jgi:hypothetical protein
VPWEFITLRRAKARHAPAAEGAGARHPLPKGATHLLRAFSPLGQSDFWSDSNRTVGLQKTGRVGRSRRFPQSVNWRGRVRGGQTWLLAAPGAAKRPLHMGAGGLKNPTVCGFSLYFLPFSCYLYSDVRGDCSPPPWHARQKVSLDGVERAVQGKAFATAGGEPWRCASVGYIVGPQNGIGRCFWLPFQSERGFAPPWKNQREGV